MGLCIVVSVVKLVTGGLHCNMGNCASTLHFLDRIEVSVGEISSTDDSTKMKKDNKKSTYSDASDEEAKREHLVVDTKSDCLQEKVVEAIHSLRSQLAQSQATLAALQMQGIALSRAQASTDHLPTQQHYFPGSEADNNSPLVDALLLEAGQIVNSRTPSPSQFLSTPGNYDCNSTSYFPSASCPGKSDVGNNYLPHSPTNVLTPASQRSTDRLTRKSRRSTPRLAVSKYTPINTSTGSSTSGVEVSSSSSRSELPVYSCSRNIHIVESFYDQEDPSSPDDPENPLYVYRTPSFKKAIERGNSHQKYGSSQSFDWPASLERSRYLDYPELLPHQTSQDSGLISGSSPRSTSSAKGRLLLPPSYPPSGSPPDYQGRHVRGSTLHHQISDPLPSYQEDNNRSTSSAPIWDNMCESSNQALSNLELTVDCPLASEISTNSSLDLGSSPGRRRCLSTLTEEELTEAQSSGSHHEASHTPPSPGSSRFSGHHIKLEELNSVSFTERSSPSSSPGSKKLPSSKRHPLEHPSLKPVLEETGNQNGTPLNHTGHQSNHAGHLSNHAGQQSNHAGNQSNHAGHQSDSKVGHQSDCPKSEQKNLSHQAKEQQATSPTGRASETLTSAATLPGNNATERYQPASAIRPTSASQPVSDLPDSASQENSVLSKKTADYKTGIRDGKMSLIGIARRKSLQEMRHNNNATEVSPREVEPLKEGGTPDPADDEMGIFEDNNDSESYMTADPSEENFRDLDNFASTFPSLSDDVLAHLGLQASMSKTGIFPIPEDISLQETEDKFSALSFAFKTDKQTLNKRLELHLRARDIAEQNIQRELEGLKYGMKDLSQLCNTQTSHEIFTKIQHHIEVLEQSVVRMSSRAEVHGAVQQELRVSQAIDIMVHHVENLKRTYEKDHSELQEARKTLLKCKTDDSIPAELESLSSRMTGPLNPRFKGNQRRASVAVFSKNLLQSRNSISTTQQLSDNFSRLVHRNSALTMSPSPLNKIENKEIPEELPGLLRRHSSSQPDGLLCNSIKESPDDTSDPSSPTKDPASITGQKVDRKESITDREMDEIQFNLRKREISKRRLTRMQSSRFLPPQTRLELLKEKLSALCSVVPHPEFGDAGPGLMVVAVAVLSIFILLLAFKFGWYGWVFQRIWSSSR